MKIKTARKIFIPLGVFVALAVNIFVDVFRLNGGTTIEIFHQFKIFFSPADYAFYWLRAVVYIFLVGFAVYQYLPKKKENEEKLNKIFPYVLLICVTKILWLFLWHYEQYVFTLIVMLVLFRLTVQVNYILYIDKQSNDKVARMLMYAPFSIYLGWIALATVANATGLLWLIGWGGLSIQEGGWAALMIVLFGFSSALKILRDKDGFFPAVIVWGVIGIYVKFPEVDLIRYAVVFVCMAVGAAALYKSIKIFKNKKEIDY